MGRAPLLCPPTSDINLFRNLVCRTKVRFVPKSGRFGDIASPANTRLHPPECAILCGFLVGSFRGMARGFPRFTS